MAWIRVIIWAAPGRSRTAGVRDFSPFFRLKWSHFLSMLAHARGACGSRENAWRRVLCLGGEKDISIQNLIHMRLYPHRSRIIHTHTYIIYVTCRFHFASLNMLIAQQLPFVIPHELPVTTPRHSGSLATRT